MPSDEPRRAPARPKPRPGPARPDPAARPAPGRGGPGPSRPAGRPGRRAAAALAADRDRAQRRWVTGGLLAAFAGVALLLVRLVASREPPAETAAAAPVNRPPEIQSLELVLEPSNIVAHAQGRDLDGDRFRYRYRWAVGGKPLPTARGAMVSRRLAPPGSLVEVEATPVDGHGTSGRPMRSSLTLDYAP